MSLRLIRRKTKGKHFTVRGTYLGVRVYQSTRTGDRETAKTALNAIEHDIRHGKFDRNGPTFAHAALAYMEHGGERTYMARLIKHFGETPISQIDQDAIDRAAIDLYPTASAATRNRSIYTPISAVLRRAGEKISLHRPLGAGGNRATGWLWPEQAFALLTEASKIDKEFGALCIVLLYTGMRLSEALGLEKNNVRLDEGFAYVPDTKNDEPRAVFLPSVAVRALSEIDIRTSGRVFRFHKSGHLYHLLKASAFKANVDLPQRSAFHIFRHTYGTWMRRYGGLDTRGLVGTGAWKDAKSAARYSHTLTTEEAGKAAMLPAPMEDQ